MPMKKSRHRDRLKNRIQRHETVGHLIADRDVYMGAQEYDKALEAINAAHAIASLDERVIHRRALPLFAVGRFADALVAVERSIAAYRLSGTWGLSLDVDREIRAEALYALGRFDEAIAEAERAKDQGRVGILLTRARSLAALRRNDEAISTFDLAMTSYQKADDRGDDNPHDVPFEFAIALLRLGDFERGMQKYKDRTTRHNNPTCDPPTPLAKRSVAGRKILVRADLGLGDFLYLTPYVVALVDAGAKVVLETPAKLVRLIQSNLGNLGGVEMKRMGDALPYCDLEWSIDSLLEIFATRVNSIPPKVIQLTAPTDRLEYWKHRLALQPGRKMAVICWTAGDQKSTNGQHRTIPLSEIENILGTEGVTFVSVERFLSAAELDRLKARFDIVHVGAETEKDLADLAAVIELADFGIVPDNTAAHLAGAMGKPTLVMLPFIADWRWHVDRDDCPWYPSARLFRQPKFGDWASVMSRVAAELAPTFNREPAIEFAPADA